MNEPEIITDVIMLAPRRALVPLTFRRNYRLDDGRAVVQINEGETMGVSADHVDELLRRRICVRPGDPLDVPAPDVTPTAIRLLRAWQSVPNQWLGSHERVTVPRHDADTLIAVFILSSCVSKAISTL